jgi:gamma-glutamyl:cysteine ligase YbdK (ATP-grasp superfamily)
MLDFRLGAGRRRAVTERPLAEHRGGVPRPLIEDVAATLEPGAAIFAVLHTGQAPAALDDAVARSHGRLIAVCRYAQERPSHTPSPEVLAENRFLASRDGMSAWFFDGTGGPQRPAADTLAEMLERCAPTADALDCTAELASVAALADELSGARPALTTADQHRHHRPAQIPLQTPVIT